MRYEHEEEGEGGRLSGAVSRFDRWGTRRGSPYAADPAYDEPPATPGTAGWTGGGGGGWSGPANRWDADAGYGSDIGHGDEPAGAWNDGWADDDGFDVQAVHLWGGPWLPPRVWARWRRRPWFPRVHRMLRTARPAGTLRSRTSGARYPVYRGRMGGRSWRVVTRPRGRMRYEVVGLEAETGGEGEMLSMMPGGGGGSPVSAGAPAAGYRLRLPHAGLHTILGRLRPEQLRALSGGALPADPAAAVARGVGRIARRARRLGRFRGAPGGPRLDVFGTPGFRLLVRPTGEMEGEILAVAPVAGELDGEAEVVYADRASGYRRSVGGKQYRVRGAHARVTWAKPFPLADVLSQNVGRDAVYVLLQKDAAAPGGFRPIYIGETTAWRARWKTRLQTLSEFGIKPDPYRVSFGTIEWIATRSPKPPPDLVRNDVEHILVRGLRKYGLNNRTSNQPILPPPNDGKKQRSFIVANVNAPAAFPREPMTARGDTLYELGPWQ
jgi:hypothetical protein